MSGLDVAVGVASVVALCNIVVSKLVPFLEDSAHADEAVKHFHREICDFKDVLVIVEANFGARTDFRLQRSFDRSKSRAMKRHVEECRRTVEEIERELPEPQFENRNFTSIMVTHLRVLLNSNVLSRLRQDIPALKATLQLWLQVLQVDGLCSSREAQEQGQQAVDSGLADLNRKMDSLKDALEKRDHDLEQSLLQFGGEDTGEDTVKRSGKECLESAGSVREAYTASYRPSPTSIAGRDVGIPRWSRDVMRQAAAEPLRSKELDAMTASITNETLPLNHGDSGYDSDQLSRLRTVPDWREGFSASFLTNLINRSIRDVQRYRESNQYDSAAAAQEKAIKWGREREQNHGIEFKDECDMLKTLAKFQLERCMYRQAEDILLYLLEGMEPDSPNAWTVDHELAKAYLAHEKYESAARHANRANNGQQNSLDIGDNKIIETLALLSEIYDKMGNRTEAAVFKLEALKHQIRQEGPSDDAMLTTLQEEPIEDDVHRIIDDLENGETKDILALKTFQWAVALNQSAIVFSLWGRYETIATYIDAQNDFGMTPLISSAAFGHEEMVRFLLGKGADVNARASNDSNNDTALMLAAEKQSISMVKQLLAKGANVRDYNKHGRNALHRAQGRPINNKDAVRKEIVSTILGIDHEGLINSQCTAGKTPLHLASESGNTPIMEFLLSMGADIEARTHGKRTSLILAVESGWPKSVELLLDWGAEHDVEDLTGRTPLKIARRGVGGSREIQALLDKAKRNSRMRRRLSIMTTSPRSPQQRNSSSVSIQRSEGRSGWSPSMFRLPLRGTSITSTTSSSTARMRPWSIYSKIDKIGLVDLPPKAPSANLPLKAPSSNLPHKAPSAGLSTISLIRDLINDDVLISTYSSAFASGNNKADKIESDFRILLRLLSVDLDKEAVHASAKFAAQVCGSHAGQIAHYVRVMRAHHEKQEEEEDVMQEMQVEDDSDCEKEGDATTGDRAWKKLEPESVTYIKTFILNSNSFTKFRLAFQRLIYPNMLKAVHRSMLPNLDGPGRHTIRFHIGWNLLEYCKTELQGSRLISRVLTVSGSAGGAVAMTCEDYIRQTWGKIGVVLLRTLEDALQQRPTSTVELSSEVGIRVWLFEEDNQTPMDLAICEATGSHDELIETAQLLAWLGAVFRTPIYGDLTYSEVLLERTEGSNFKLAISTLQPIPAEEQSCWHGLFVNSVIARGFPVPKRQDEKGIELPFDVMMRLSGVLYPVFHKDGIFFKGYSRLLFPTAYHSESQSIQWHLHSSNDLHSQIPHGEIANHNRANINDLEKLENARTFLGYCELAEVHLGTADSCESYNSLTYSRADNEDPAPGITPASAMIGSSGMGIFSTQISGNVVYPKGLSHHSRRDCYEDMLDSAKDMPILLYDDHPGSKRAWLVPMLSTILHMVHTWARGRSDLLADVPHAKAHWDGGLAAWSSIKGKADLKLRDSVDNRQEYCLKDIIKRIWIDLDEKMEIEALSKRELHRTIKFERQKLYGWEFMDIARGNPHNRRKEVSLNEDWVVFGEEVLVLFCQGLKEVIRPAPGAEICEAWSPVPPKRNYFTATVKCLQQLAIERGYQNGDPYFRLANHAYWQFPGGALFANCRACQSNAHRGKSKCEKDPQTVAKKCQAGVSRAAPPIEGAVIFGDKRVTKLWIVRMRVG